MSPDVLPHLWIFMTLLLLHLTSSQDANGRYRSRMTGNNGSSVSHQNLKLFPGGTEKRTVYTGRYCAYPTTSRIPQRVKNGTQTYLRRVVSQCPWTSLYCNPQVRYVVSSRHSYSIQMQVITRDEWRCCPGFSGPHCEEVCFNCTTVADLSQRIEQLSRQIVSGNPGESGQTPVNQLPGTELQGPQGPPGPMGLRGQRGPPGVKGQKGDVGSMGLRGFPGSAGPAGEPGLRGTSGEPGTTGSAGSKGDKGDQGPAGPSGFPGSRGERGMAGIPADKGDVGSEGPAGQKGDQGETGAVGPAGIGGVRGQLGPIGPQGPPGPPGVCGCDAMEVTTTSPPEGLGSNDCIHEGVSRQNQALWKSGDCRECICLDGTVECFEILCADLSCRHTYRPTGYCCPLCCPNQIEDPTHYESGDGSDETLPTHDEAYNYTETYGDPGAYYGDEIEYDSPTPARLDPMGCPIAPLTVSPPVTSRSSETRLDPDWNQVGDEDALCMLSKDAGPCRARISRIYFDSETMECRPFVYGGCEGNANNFETPDDCQRLCVKDAVSAPAEIIQDDIRPRRATRCNARKDAGGCRAIMPRFYYDQRDSRCKLFTYGGCGGNSNRFLTPWACRDSCGGGDPVYVNSPSSGSAEGGRNKPARCYLKKDKGPCKAIHSQFYYNANTNKCQLFYYGGCGGNDNRFTLPTECQDVCGGEPSFEYERDPVVQSRNTQNNVVLDKCTLPLDEGPCKGTFYRYFFNSETNKCSVFVYGGCRGNENNFPSADECQADCGGDGFNFTITLQSDILDQRPPLQLSREQGQRGPPGEAGPPGIGLQGAPGPPGPVGPPGPPALSPLAENEILSMKTTIESLKSRILFLETQFLTNQLPTGDDETVEVPRIVALPRDDVADNELPPPIQRNPDKILKSSPVGRGDNADEVFPLYDYSPISESD